MDETSERHMVNLRPALLFRTVGLTGLSASLPPHRRLRSVLNTTRNISGQSVDRSDPLTGGSHRNTPLNGLKRIQTRDRQLPKISRAKPQKDDETSMNEQPQTVSVQRWHHDGRLNATARTRGRDVGYRTEKEEYLFEEVWRGQTLKMTRKNKNKRVKIRDEASELSQWIQSLEITDRKREQHWNDSGWRGFRAEPVCKWEEQKRRDRRPHFLPPISQSDCLLNVPLLLPDNSPPPTPCSPSDILFFPLSIPHIQRRGDAPAQHH
ncbi:uncharacterized protein LOC120490152 isoform X2 [Pimephales promelas]|nr:uncharacterized protein LOC120490152 isoform X2 [Pimephales promelas]